MQQLVLDRINTIRPQLPPDASVTLGPNASSMGWIYQYALVDQEGMHDLRELRLLNEEPDQAGVADGARRGGSRLGRRSREAVSDEDFPPLLAKAGISLRQVIAAVQSVFQEAGGRTIEVTNREYQLRGVIDNEDIDKLEYIVVGRRPDGEAGSPEGRRLHSGRL